MDTGRIEAAVAAFGAGEMVVVSDNSSRENEGDLVMAAEMVTPASVNFMAGFGRGLICVPMTADRAAQFEAFMLDAETQRQIADFGQERFGRPLFRPLLLEPRPTS